MSVLIILHTALAELEERGYTPKMIIMGTAFICALREEVDDYQKRELSDCKFLGIPFIISNVCGQLYFKVY